MDQATSQGDLFNELFKDIEIQTLTPDNMEAYKYSEIRYEDLYNFTGAAEMMGMEKGEEIGLERGLKRGRKEGLEKGIEKGIHVTKYEIARNLLNYHMSLSDITKITGLTPDEILKLS
jgi:predicted transposase/invertase (TIGR01784 family)